jgi:hypothetical protein
MMALMGVRSSWPHVGQELGLAAVWRDSASVVREDQALVGLGKLVKRLVAGLLARDALDGLADVAADGVPPPAAR